MESDSIRVAIYEPSPIVLHGLKDIFSTDPCIEIVLEAASKTELLDLPGNINIHIFLIGLEDDGQSESKFLQEILRSPGGAKIIVLTDCNHHNESSVKNRMLEVVRLGVKGFQCKYKITADEIIQAVRTVYAGGMSLASCVTHALLENELPNQSSAQVKLSNREKQVLELVAMGKSNSEIADSLYISICTVKCHVSSILTKLKVKNRTQATLWMI